MLLAVTPASAQTVEAVVDGMLAAVERSARAVDDYTVVSRVMGRDIWTYFESRTVDGRAMFQPVRSSPGGLEVRMGDHRIQDVTEYIDVLLDHGAYGGMVDVRGAPAHLLVVEDASSLQLRSALGSRDTELVIRQVRLRVDAARWVPLEIELTGEALRADESMDVTTIIRLLDYRQIDELLLPFQTTITTEGLEETVDSGIEAQLEDLTRRLEEMEPERRAMIEEMLGPEIDRLWGLLAGDGEPVSVTIDVVDVRVNEGAPS